MTRTLRAVIFSFLYLGLFSRALDWAAETPHWTYDGENGPRHWSQVSPDFALCSGGTRQSPINISRASAGDLAPLEFSYRPSDVRLVNNGHTIEQYYDPGSYLQLGKTRFDLIRFHFHRPGEEQIGGKKFAMSIHFVHKDVRGRLAVVAVLVNEGRSNSALGELWRQLPKLGETIVRPRTINAEGLLPAKRSYFTYEGSLTTPPCSEGVTWLVLEHPIEASAAQIAAFSSLYPGNARPIQPLNGRLIRHGRS